MVSPVSRNGVHAPAENTADNLKAALDKDLGVEARVRLLIMERVKGGAFAVAGLLGSGAADAILMERGDTIVPVLTIAVSSAILWFSQKLKSGLNQLQAGNKRNATEHRFFFDQILDRRRSEEADAHLARMFDDMWIEYVQDRRTIVSPPSAHPTDSSRGS